MNMHFRILLCFLPLLFTGCASVHGPADPRDPLEGYNRAAYEFNDGVDRYFLKPVAQGYDAITPDPVQLGISNFFSNLDDVLVIVNDLLQLKLVQFASDTGRFLINSTLGLGGLIDWATEFGLEKHNEDFGQTLGHWGVPAGPYVVIPFIGPSNFRDFGGNYADTASFDPIWQEVHEGLPPVSRDESTAWSMKFGQTVGLRASLLKAENILDEAALDRYTFIRETYMQRRLNLVHDGAPPEAPQEFNEDELFNFEDTSPAPVAVP